MIPWLIENHSTTSAMASSYMARLFHSPENGANKPAATRFLIALAVYSLHVDAGVAQP